MHRLILASESPRRRQLLLEAGFQFETLSVKVSEIPGKSLTVDEKILANAKEKSLAAWARLQSRKNEAFLVLTADTEVVLDGELLGKPQNEVEARLLLEKLSGRTHEVKTALCLKESQTQREVTHIETTEVTFKTLSSEQISKYISTGEPFDKAGGYGIQGHGAAFVEKYLGSYENVVGLAVESLKKILMRESWTLK